MAGYIIVSIAGGMLFLIMDVLINGNPLALSLYEFYKPIARTSVNAPAGVGIDLAYGFFMAGVILLLNKSLPGKSDLVKGMSFGLLVWSFRGVMSTASSWVMFEIPCWGTDLHARHRAPGDACA